MPAVLVDRVGELSDPCRVDIFRHARVKGDTYELRWRRDGERDNQGSYEDFSTALSAAQHVYSALRQGLQLPIGRAARESRRDGAGDSDGAGGGRARPEVVMSLRGLMEAWLAQHTGKVGTKEGHRQNFDYYVFPVLPSYDDNGRRTGASICLEKIPPGRLTRTDVAIWKNALGHKPNQKRPGTTISDSTVNSALVTLRACLSWAQTEDYVARNVAREVSHSVYGARKPAWFKDEDEFWSTLEHCPEWSRAPLVCMIYLGARFGELAALQVEDIDFEAGKVWFLRNMDDKGRLGTLKTPSSEDWVALHAVAAEYLRDYIRQRNRRPGQIVFVGPRRGGRLHNSVLRAALQRGLAGAGLDKGITVHGARHSTATWLRKAGVDQAVIQRILRHGDPRTTAIYTHVEEEERQAAVHALSGPTRPVEPVAAAGRASGSPRGQAPQVPAQGPRRAARQPRATAPGGPAGMPGRG